MADKTDQVWAIDRSTNEAGQYDPAFLAAWPNGYLRIDPPKTKKQTARPASTASASDAQQEREA